MSKEGHTLMHSSPAHDRLLDNDARAALHDMADLRAELTAKIEDMRVELINRDATIRGYEEYIADADKLLRAVSAVLENGYAIGFEQRYRIAEKIFQFLKFPK